MLHLLDIEVLLTLEKTVNFPSSEIFRRKRAFCLLSNKCFFLKEQAYFTLKNVDALIIKSSHGVIREGAAIYTCFSRNAHFSCVTTWFKQTPGTPKKCPIHEFYLVLFVFT